MAYIAKNGLRPISGLQMVKPRPKRPLMDPTRGKPLPRPTGQYQSVVVDQIVFFLVQLGLKLMANIANNGPSPISGLRMV